MFSLVHMLGRCTLHACAKLTSVTLVQLNELNAVSKTASNKHQNVIFFISNWLSDQRNVVITCYTSIFTIIML